MKYIKNMQEIYKKSVIEFEWDELENISNQDKHGVSFEEAIQIWEDDNLYVTPAYRRGEKRYIALGKLYVSIFTVVHTKRGETIRIISARLATKKEREEYERRKR